MDVPTRGVGWAGAKGINCGPHWNFVQPVPHDVVETGSGVALDGLALWPKRIRSVKCTYTTRGDPNVLNNLDVELMAQAWHTRDDLLQKELNHYCQHEQYRQVQRSGPPPQWSLAICAPCLPVLALAHLLQQRNLVSRAHSLTAATQLLLRHDRMFGLSLFLGFQLVDRTGTLRTSVRMDESVCRPTPSKEQVDEYLARTQPKDAMDGLRRGCLGRAEALWKESNGRPIVVCWSGGIDSTAVLVSLLKTARTKQRQNRLRVLMDDESHGEYPLFFETYIKDKLMVIPRSGRTVGEVTKRLLTDDAGGGGALCVTGELGDQLFGSDRCRVAFREAYTVDLNEADQALMTTLEQKYEVLEEQQANLEDPWESYLLPRLEELGFISSFAERKSWVAWIRPQLEKAPFPIVTLYDMFWWLNFSCKWQSVSLRCLHDGGGYRPKKTNKKNHSVLGHIRHFFDDPDLECWACVERFHKEAKFPNLQKWSSYKQPLKELILEYSNDRDYFENKTKVGSLSFGVATEQQRYQVESIVGLYRTDMSGTTVQDLRWGAECMRECSPHSINISTRGIIKDLSQVLEPWIVEKITTTHPLGSKTLHVEVPKPDEVVSDSTDSTSPESWTRCHALLPPIDRIENGDILLLGKALAPLATWCLRHGANRVVCLEPQRDVCDQLQQDVHAMDRTCPGVFEAHCEDAMEGLVAYGEASFDLVVGVLCLETWPKPMDVLEQMARVSKRHVCLEESHPEAVLQGLVSDDEGFTGLTANCFGSLDHTVSVQSSARGSSLSFGGVSRALESAGLRVCRVRPVATDETLGIGGTGGSCKPYLDTTKGTNRPSRYILRCDKVISHECDDSKDYAEQEPTATTTTLKNDEKDVDEDYVVVAPTSSSSPATAQSSFLSWESLDKTAELVAFDGRSDPAPYRVEGWSSENNHKGFVVVEDDGVSVFGYVFSGTATLTRVLSSSSSSYVFSVYAGMYFSCPGSCRVEGGCGFVAVSPHNPSHPEYRALFAIGGPVDADGLGNDSVLMGRLPYIDGCTDTLLIAPVVKGAACLNHLHFPPGIAQTHHTHPSGRVGMVIAGSGVCVTKRPLRDDEDVDDGPKTDETPLKPGTVFVIPTDVVHAFRTSQSDTLDVIAFHPDSDFGATPQDHPMVNRTIVNGVSASKMPSIQTKMM